MAPPLASRGETNGASSSPDAPATAEAAPTPATPAEAVPPAQGSDATGTPPAEAPPTAQDADGPPPSNKRWYVVKVQSGREESIKDACERRVKIEGLEEYFGQIIIPVEKVTELRKGKRVVKERKLYPGYLMVEVEYNDRILYLFRETSGVGDFVGGTPNQPPAPMSDREVQRMLGSQGKDEPGKVVAIHPKFTKGDRLKVKDGTFAGMEGEVAEVNEAKNSVKLQLTIFGRLVPVELEYWQVDQV
jgi:transcriptional antiterminator NusG